MYEDRTELVAGRWWWGAGMTDGVGPSRLSTDHDAREAMRGKEAVF